MKTRLYVGILHKSLISSLVRGQCAQSAGAIYPQKTRTTAKTLLKPTPHATTLRHFTNPGVSEYAATEGSFIVQSAKCYH